MRLKPERRLKLRERGVASSAPAPRVLALMAKAAEWNGRISVGSFAGAGAGMVRTNPPLLDGLLAGPKDPIPDGNMPPVGWSSASWLGCAGSVGSADSCSCALAMKQKDAGRIISTAASLIRTMVRLFLLS